MRWRPAQAGGTAGWDRQLVLVGARHEFQLMLIGSWCLAVGGWMAEIKTCMFGGYVSELPKELAGNEMGVAAGWLGLGVAQVT